MYKNELYNLQPLFSQIFDVNFAEMLSVRQLNR